MISSASVESAAGSLPERKTAGHFRPARALIGWLPPDAAHELLVSGLDDQTVGPGVVARARLARDFASKRAAVDQREIVGQPPTGVAAHLTQRQNAQNLFDEGFRVCTVDLSQLYAIQPTIFTDHNSAAIETVDPDDIRTIAPVTLPLGIEVQVAVAPDPAQRTITLSSANLNLRLVGLLEPQMGPSGCAVGFQTIVSNSLLQAGYLGGRYYCRDGHTRALQLLKRGITTAPAIVKEFASYAEVAPGANLLPEAVACGENPPTLADFLDDQVSADVWLPMTRKVIMISAKEVEIPV